MQDIELWTDGSCYPNPGPGGWAYRLVGRTELGSAELSSGSCSLPHTTNNHMEMKAILEGLMFVLGSEFAPRLEQTPAGDRPGIQVYTDSAYVANCFKERWYRKWKKNGWINSAGKPVENKEIWQSLLWAIEVLAEVGVRVTFNHVRGHVGHEHNEFCDKLAHAARLQAANMLNTGGQIPCQTL